MRRSEGGEDWISEDSLSDDEEKDGLLGGGAGRQRSSTGGKSSDNSTAGAPDKQKCLKIGGVTAGLFVLVALALMIRQSFSATPDAANGDNNAGSDNTDNGASNNIPGIIVAAVSSILVGSSFAIKKIGLVRMGTTEGWAYLREPIWWLGFLTMTVGEIGNFVAYALAPPILVTPIGVLAVFCNAFFSSVLLGDTMSSKGTLGMVLCVAGSLLIMLFAPGEEPITSVKEISIMMGHWAFKTYASIATITAIGMVILDNFSDIGTRVFYFYVLICSVVGSLLVLCIKGLGVAIVVTIGGENQFYPSMDNRATFYFIVGTVIMLISQLHYLNRALHEFGPAKVFPVYSVMFTSLVLTSSACLYHNLESVSVGMAFGVGFGLLMNYVGVIFVGREVKHPDDMRPGEELNEMI